MKKLISTLLVVVVLFNFILTTPVHASSIPAEFDLRDEIDGLGMEQQSGGTCFIYATLKVVETYVAMNGGELYNLDEEHVISSYSAHGLNAKSGGFFCIEDGGSGIWENYFEPGYGPVEEESDDTPIITLNEYKEYNIVDRRSEVKRHIMENGAVYASIKFSSVAFNDSKYDIDGVVCNNSEAGNHAVAIIGWSDILGGWIALNSAGTFETLLIYYDDTTLATAAFGITDADFSVNDQIPPEVTINITDNGDKKTATVTITDEGGSKLNDEKIYYAWTTQTYNYQNLKFESQTLNANGTFTCSSPKYDEDGNEYFLVVKAADNNNNTTYQTSSGETININHGTEAENTLKKIDESDISSTIPEGEDESTSNSGFISKVLSTVVTIITSLLNIVPFFMRAGMFIISGEEFTIEKAVFNKIELFNANYFKISGDSIENKTLKESVSKFFYINRYISVGLAVIILIYIGIRMALATTVNGKVKYKHMLIGWIESMVILFLLPYIMVIAFYGADVFEDLIIKIYNVFISNGEIGIETEILSGMELNIANVTGWTSALYTPFYWYLVFIQAKFCTSYLKRLLRIGFLIVLSPYMTLIYSIDKAGDGKAQSFKNWLNELLVNIYIQPIYALIYAIFMIAAGEIMEYSMFFAMLFLLIMTRVEKIIFKLFNIKSSSLKAIKDERKKNK